MKKFSLGFVIVSGFFLAGCSDSEDEWTVRRPQVAPVSGRVVYNGQPLADANINFTSETGKVSAYGRTDKDGRFRLTTFRSEDGAVPGRHVVTVRKDYLTIVPHPTEPDLGPIKSEQRSLIPEQYRHSNSSGLFVEIPDDGTKDVVIELRG